MQLSFREIYFSLSLSSSLPPTLPFSPSFYLYFSPSFSLYLFLFLQPPTLSLYLSIYLSIFSPSLSLFLFFSLQPTALSLSLSNSSSPSFSLIHCQIQFFSWKIPILFHTCFEITSPLKRTLFCSFPYFFCYFVKKNKLTYISSRLTGYYILYIIDKD